MLAFGSRCGGQGGPPLPWGSVAGRALRGRARLASPRLLSLQPVLCRRVAVCSEHLSNVSFPLCLPSSLLSWAALGPDSCSVGIEE